MFYVVQMMIVTGSLKWLLSAPARVSHTCSRMATEQIGNHCITILWNLFCVYLRISFDSAECQGSK